MSTQTITIAHARSDMLTRADVSAALERDQQVDALQQAGLLRSVSADLVSRYARLEPGQREAIRDALAGRRFAPLLSEQIIVDRGEA
jgi:hypothetical protein